MERFSLVLTACLVFAACAPMAPNSGEVPDPVTSAGIVNGARITTRNTRGSKSVVGIRMLDASGNMLSFCTATLVAQDAIVTAAHCFDKKLAAHPVAGYEIFFDENIYTHGHTIALKKFVSHPKYNSETMDYGGQQMPIYDHDIAVGLLQSPAPSAFLAAHIDSNTSADYSNQSVTVFGFGRLQDYSSTNQQQDGWDSIGFLNTSQMLIDGKFTALPDRYFMQTQQKTSICQGDSGGANFMTIQGQLTLVGVNSAEYGAAVPGGFRACSGAPAQITKVSAFADWIKASLDSLRASGRHN